MHYFSVQTPCLFKAVSQKPSTNRGLSLLEPIAVFFQGLSVTLTAHEAKLCIFQSDNTGEKKVLILNLI